MAISLRNFASGRKQPESLSLSLSLFLCFSSINRGESSYRRNCFRLYYQLRFMAPGTWPFSRGISLRTLFTTADQVLVSYWQSFRACNLSGRRDDAVKRRAVGLIFLRLTLVS